jgi:AcrR family transcriptional regulator
VAGSVAEGFQRARRPEQREVRRQAILDATRVLLDRAEVAEVSLREIAREVGCANSNVLRYFGTREGVLLALLDHEWGDWLADLERALPAAGTGAPVHVVARTAAETVAAHPRMCKLMSALSGLLRTEAPESVAAAFHQASATRNLQAARLLAERVPGLSTPLASELMMMASAYVAGWWPLAQSGQDAPEPPLEDPDLVRPHTFVDGLARGLHLMLAGLLVESAFVPGAPAAP